MKITQETHNDLLSEDKSNILQEYKKCRILEFFRKLFGKMKNKKD